REREQLAGRTTQGLVERANVDSCKCLGKKSLARPTTPPRLSERSTVRHWNMARDLCRLQAPPHRAVIFLKSDQRPTVKHQLHAALRRRLRPADRDLPLITTADFRSDRRCAVSSSAEISPNFAS